MISLSRFKAELLVFVRLMIKTNMMYVDVSYKGRAYRFHMEDLGMKVKQVHRKRIREDLTKKIDADECPECEKLMLNGVCMNSSCARSIPATPRRQKDRQPVA